MRIFAICISLLCFAGCIDERSSTRDTDQTDSGRSSDTQAPTDPSTVVDIGVTPASDVDVFPDECLSADDCPAGSDCDNGVCTEPECSGDGDCSAVVQACVEGACRDRCLGPGTCLRGGVCMDGICLPPECEADDACADGERCLDGSCVEIVSCSEDADCTDVEECVSEICEPLPECVGDRGCEEGRICDEGYCRVQEACSAETPCLDGYDCVGGFCVPALCRGQSDCPEGQLCLGGGCSDELDVEIASVVILNPPQTVETGARYPFAAVALDLRGDIVPTDRIFFESSDEDILAFEDGTSTAIMADNPGTAQVTAVYLHEEQRVESQPVDIRVVAPSMGPGLQVHLVDAETGVALGGVAVRYGMNTLVTDETGVVAFEEADPTLVLTAFSRNHDYVSILGVEAGDVLLPLTPRSSSTRVAGISGEIEFDRVRTDGDVELSLSGASFGQGLTRVSLIDLLGPTFNTSINAGVGDFDLPIPAGVTLAAELPIIGLVEAKGRYYASAAPGLRLAWSFAGRLDVGRLIALAQGGGGGDIGQILSTLLPFFETFEHGLRVGERLVALSQIIDEDDLDGDGDVDELRPDYERFPVLNIRPDQAQGLRVAVDLENALGDDDITILFPGAELQGLGFVPLGLTAAQESGNVPVRMVAPYSGLEAGQPTFLAISATFGDAQDLPRDLTLYIQRYSDRIPENVSFPEGAATRPSNLTWNAVMRALDAESGANADAHRAVLFGPDGRWEVYFGPDAVPTIQLPFPPEGFDDLAASPEVHLEALQLIEDVDFSSVLRLGDNVSLGAIDAVVRTVARRAF